MGFPMSHPLVITGSSLPLNSAITKPSPASCFLEVLLPSGTSTNSLCMGQNFLTVDEDSPLSTLSIHSLRTFGEIKGIRSIFLYHITKVPNSCHSQKRMSLSQSCTIASENHYTVTGSETTQPLPQSGNSSTGGAFHSCCFQRHDACS